MATEERHAAHGVPDIVAVDQYCGRTIGLAWSTGLNQLRSKCVEQVERELLDDSDADHTGVMGNCSNHNQQRYDICTKGCQSEIIINSY